MRHELTLEQVWVVVRTEGRYTKAVAESCNGYVPTTERWTKPHGKRVAVVSAMPLFPGWVFVRYGSVIGCGVSEMRGVHGVMKDGKGVPLWLSESDIARVRAIELEHKLHPSQKLTPPEVVEPVSVSVGVGERVWVDLAGGRVSGVIVEIKGRIVVVDTGGIVPWEVDCCLVSKHGV